MTAFALAVPFADEQRLTADAARYGHVVVLRCSGAGELAARLAGCGAESVVVAAESQYLDAPLVAACDAAGVRLIAIAGDERLTRSLGLLDTVPAPADWEAIAAVGRPADPPPVAPAPGRGRREGVIVVWGPSGGPGAHLARDLDRRRARRRGTRGRAR